MSGPSLRMVLAALTGLLLLPAAAPAYADETWVNPSCATGEITNFSVEPSWAGAAGDVVIRLDGWSLPCPPDGEPTLSTRAAFGLILYSDSGAWVGRLTDYDSATSPTPFTYRVNYTTERRFGDPIDAVCLAYHYHDRLSCLAVDFTHRPALFPISAQDDRFVGVPVARYCGNCAIPPEEDDG